MYDTKICKGSMPVARGLKLIRNCWERRFKIFITSYSRQSEGGSSVSQRGSWQCSSGSGAQWSTWSWWSTWLTLWIYELDHHADSEDGHGQPDDYDDCNIRVLSKKTKIFLGILPIMRWILCFKLYLTQQRCYWWRWLAFRWWALCHQETAECRNCQQRDHDEPQTPHF